MRARPRRAVVYRSPLRAPSRTQTDITENGVGTIICEQCGASVARLVSGKPRAHAPGGTRPNTRQGRYKCAGSGNDGTWKAPTIK